MPEQIPGASITLGKGQNEYAKLVLYDEGDAGRVAIGEGAAMLIATEPVRVQGIMGLFVFKIFGKGEFTYLLDLEVPVTQVAGSE